jgi:hypothetical protein
VGSRVRIATAACLVASGLLAGSAGAGIAFADPTPTIGDSGDRHTNGPVGNRPAEKPKSDPDEKKTTPRVGPKTEDDGKDGNNGKSGDNGRYPGNGNCGRRGNGCGGGSGNGNNGSSGNPRNGGNPGNGTNGDGGDVPKPPRPPEPPVPPDAPGQCGTRNDEHCSPGSPGPGQHPVSGGGGGGGGHAGVPSGRPGLPPPMQLTPELKPPATEPIAPSVIDAAPGVGVAAAQLPIPPVTMPVIVAPPAGPGGGGWAGAPSSPALPGTPHRATAEPPAGREPLPAKAGSNLAVPASSYRVGYTDYLRKAGLSQVAALAVPGIAGMLVLTGAGGLVGYRQAKAGHAVRTSATARFVN